MEEIQIIHVAEACNTTRLHSIYPYADPETRPNHAVQFRDKFLNFLDHPDAWGDHHTKVVLNFENIRNMTPSFCKEAIAYFRKYASAEKILSVIKMINLTPIQRMTMELELEYDRSVGA